MATLKPVIEKVSERYQPTQHRYIWHDTQQNTWVFVDEAEQFSDPFESYQLCEDALNVYWDHL